MVHTVRAVMTDPNINPDSKCCLQVDLVNCFQFGEPSYCFPGHQRPLPRAGKVV